jgi:hypothetical protein
MAPSESSCFGSILREAASVPVSVPAGDWFTVAFGVADIETPVEPESNSLDVAEARCVTVSVGVATGVGFAVSIGVSQRCGMEAGRAGEESLRRAGALTRCPDSETPRRRKNPSTTLGVA